MIYLDNGATSWPKPESVYRATDRALRNAANPGRGGHKFSRDSARVVLESREVIARFFGVSDPRHIIFTSGATEGLNAIIYGLATKVTRILSLGHEHNALWRPLEDVVQRNGISVQYIQPLQGGIFDWSIYEEGLAASPHLVIITHASNVTGEIYPLERIVHLAKNAGAKVCVDISQTAGTLDINFEELGIDFAAFPGHKGLLGPPGIGGVYVAPGIELHPHRLGGTGSNSAESGPPLHLPERYESGTINVPGVVGLAAGVVFLMEKGLEKVHHHEQSLRGKLVEGLSRLGTDIYGAGPAVGVLSFNIQGIDSMEVAYILDDVYGICVRGGLHCCPRGHTSLGTFAKGTIRASLGIFNTMDDVDALIAAVSEIIEQSMG